ncbi:MAG: DEAD/DEAH box helicase [Planctomycetaceae bacterium]|nr:DEAD/DEAH box helicase [Planctomycetaceae bacterium]
MRFDPSQHPDEAFGRPPSRSPDAPRAAGTPSDPWPEGGPSPARGGRRRLRRAVGADAVARALKDHAELGPKVISWREEPPRDARFAPFPDALDPRLAQILKEKGREQLFLHQAQAVELALGGRDVLVATPTASGKTLAYTLPVMQSLLESGGRARAIWMFPTKALSQDQSTGLNALLERLVELAPELGGLHSFTYDGDTPPSVRRTLRERGHVVLTNPWMLHSGILPNHAKWADLFRELRYIVIDEVHTMSGVFGSSVANVLRRLLRIAHYYGADPKFLLSSATLREPAAHGRALIGRGVEVVEDDGSAAGKRIFGVYEPPLLDAIAGLRASALEEARHLADVLCGPAHQTIFFCNRRTSVEVLTRYLKEGASRYGLKPEEVRGYRGGYLPLLRREVEAGLRDGSVKVVVTTNALELGIDIGRLDVAVLVGYPGTQASFWQRAGRVGRRGDTSLVVMIARSDPIDQYLAHHPEHLFEGARERLGLDADNLVLLSEQLKCAAFELPFHAKDFAEDGTAPKGEAFGSAPHVPEILDYLSHEAGLLHERDGTWYWMADTYPAQNVSLAGGEPDNVLVLDKATGKALGEVDREASITTVHDGAIYQVEGVTWKIEWFDYKNRRAYARSVESDYFTEAQADTEVRVLRLEERAVRPRLAEPEDFSIWRGEVHVNTVATQYKKIRFYTRENVGSEDIHLPPEELDTESFLLSLSNETAADLGLFEAEGGAAFGAFASLLRRVAPLFVRCQPADLGLSSRIRAPHFDRPTLYLYDRVQGGVGLSTLLFGAARELFGAAMEVVEGCACLRGCPACVGPLEEVGPRGKELVKAILTHLLAGGAPKPVELEEHEFEAGGAPV